MRIGVHTLRIAAGIWSEPVALRILSLDRRRLTVLCLTLMWESDGGGVEGGVGDDEGDDGDSDGDDDDGDDSDGDDGERTEERWSGGTTTEA